MKDLLKYLIIIVVSLTISSCQPWAMSNDEIIAETKKCESAGLRAMATYYPNGAVTRISCMPLNTQTKEVKP
jgi:hypothetical protein